MKKIFTVSLFAVIAVVSCNFKDKYGEAPLIDDGHGYLIDNPEYVDPQKEQQKSERDAEVAQIQEGMKAWADSHKNGSSEDNLQKRINFSNTFRSKVGNQKIKVSGKDKTTVKFTDPLNSLYTPVQFENTKQMDELRELGFKKVIFSDGAKIISTRYLD